MSNSSYKEALVEATQLRKIALQRAREAVVADITPRLKEAIEKSLLNEGDDEDDDVEVLQDKKECNANESEESSADAVNENEKELELTAEAADSLAKIAGATAETFGVLTLRLYDKLQSLHNESVNDFSYTERLRQLQKETEKTYLSFQNEVKDNNIPEGAAKVIAVRLEEVYGAVNNLYVPVKVKMVSESHKALKDKFRRMNIVKENYSLTKKAKKSFREMCKNLVEESKTLHTSLTELRAITENSEVNKFAQKVNETIKEILKMATKNGALNEEEMKIVVRGLNLDDPEGSVLSAEVEEDMEMDDDMGMDDEMDMDDDMDMDMDMEDDDMEMDLDEMDMDEYGMRMPGAGSTRKRKLRRGDMAAAAEKDAAAKKDDEIMDEMDELTLKGPGATRKRKLRRGDMAAAAAASKDADKKEKESMDETIQISEEMLKTELKKLRNRRRMFESMSEEGGHGPGDLDDFGGGSGDGEKFVDGEGLNDLDPVAEGEMDELTLKGPGSTRKKKLRRGDMAAAAEKDADKKEKNESVSLNKEILATINAYKDAVKDLAENNRKLKKEVMKSKLWNNKLVYANKLLSQEGLNKKQRLTVIEALEEAKSLEEVKKVYASLSEAISGKEDQKINESVERKVLGGSSRATKSGASTLTESEQKEYARWGTLAGIIKN